MILLLRHGQTEWNVERRVQGQTESRLTALGERQAEAMARLTGELVARDPGPWRLASSPVGRALRTAEAVARVTGLAPEIDPRLAEICCGEWEGRLWDDIAASLPPGTDRMTWFFMAPGGETFDDVDARARSWLASLDSEPERKVIAVSHGVWGRLARGAYAGLERKAILDQDVPQDAVYRLQNGQIDRFDCEPVE